MATFSGTTTSTIVLGNPPAQNPLTVTSTGLVDVNSASAGAVGILGGGGFAWTISNFGTVESIGSLGVGIYLGAGGGVTHGTRGAPHAPIPGRYFRGHNARAPGPGGKFRTIPGVCPRPAHKGVLG